MTLEIQCRDEAEYSSALLGVGTGPQRAGGTVKSFGLCTNHSDLFHEIDRELVREGGWAPSFTDTPPVRIL